MYTDLQLYIDGEWLNGSGRKSEDVLNPATGKVLASLPHASKADLDRALDAAEKDLAVWRATSAYDRAKVLHITLAYLGSFVLFAWLRTFVNDHPLGGELGPVTGPMYQLFMFFMVTDPRTIVRGKWKQVGVVFVIGFAECVIRLLCDFDVLPAGNPLCAAPPMFALFLVGPAFFFAQLRNQPAK